MWPLSYDTYFDINSGLFSKIDKKLNFSSSFKKKVIGEV